MDQLIELAKRLGRQMAAHERTKLLKKAQKAVDQDDQAHELVNGYQLHADKINKLQEEHKPIEVEDKHKLRDLEEKMSQNPNLSELTRRQVDFLDMMSKVRQAIDSELGLEK